MEQSSEKQNEIEYWQKRAKREYGYKGEVIYTEEKNYYGIDISENMIEIAKNRAYKDNMRIFYNVSTNGLQGISDFDFIYSVSLFAHISDEDMKKMFENIYKILVRGGGILYM